jgi:hypothetical protein
MRRSLRPGWPPRKRASTIWPRLQAPAWGIFGNRPDPGTPSFGRSALNAGRSLTGGHAAYAAFSAVDFQAPHVRQPKSWRYVGSEWEDKFCEVAEAKVVDSGENVVMLIPEDNGVFYLQEGGPAREHRLSWTNPVQTDVDLFHCGGRGEEAAEALLEQNLKRAWKVRGLL